jgi:hypothetical protein
MAAASAVIGSALLAGEARAQTTDALDEAGAQQLFDEGRALMNKRDYARACPKFEASRRADPAAGTILNLANCYEKNGQVASAWVTFKDAAVAAHQTGRKEWEIRARHEIEDLERQLSYLVVHVAPAAAATPGLVIDRDGRALLPEMLGTPLPTDPGTHHLEARAPGKVTFRVDVTVAARPGSQDVNVPALANLPPPLVAVSPPAPARPTPVADDASSRQVGNDGQGRRTVGVVMGAVGIAAVGVGAVTGILTITKNHQASACPSDGPCASAAAVDASNSARTLGDVSTASFIAGGALLAGGVLVYLLAPREEHKTTPASAARSLSLAPLVGSSSAGVGVSGSF